MARKPVHKTMRGRVFDMKTFSERNGNTPAIGNANMNARGDILGKMNEVIVPREKVMVHPNRIQRQQFQPVSLKQDVQTPSEMIAPKPRTIRKNSSGMDIPQSIVQNTVNVPEDENTMASKRRKLK